jgi:hypothetical protein
LVFIYLHLEHFFDFVLEKKIILNNIDNKIQTIGIRVADANKYEKIQEKVLISKDEIRTIMIPILN